MRFLQLYIPHGSDNTPICFTAQQRQYMLYIPHGSDNTYKEKYQKKKLPKIFISHMVQIILAPNIHICNLFRCLYIPHGSDNTNFVHLDIDKTKPLYIPHGSDNTKRLTKEV